MLLPILASFQLATATPAPVERVFNGREHQTVVALPRVETEVTVDGRLDEPVWQQAALLTGFSLYQPVDGRPAPDSTEVLVWYSSSAMYFGIRAYESHAAVTVSLADRDRISSDDNVEIHLDTFDELNRALVFAVNPLGVQADGTKSEGGGFIPGSNVGPGQNDLSADFVWQSRGQVTDWGYEVEVRIPFSSMRYPSSAAQKWGIQIDRHVQHSGYEETWTPAIHASASFIVQEGFLTGLTGMHHGTSVELNPEVTNTVSGTPCCSPLQQSWRYTSNPQVGGNVRWALGSNFVLNGTVKPDFSQVEADATQIAADERFALFYPEKRPFFVEALDQFNVPNSLVYTRTIVQPAGAVKLTGKVGRADVAVLSAVDQGATSFNGQRPLVDLVRLRQSFWEQSQAGILYSDRVATGRANRAFGGDTKIVFGGEYFAQFQFVESVTRTTSGGGVLIPVVNGAQPSPSVTQRGPMWEAVLDGTGRSYGFHYNVLGIHPDFQTDNGFVPRTGFVQPNVAERYTWYGAQGALFEKFNMFGIVNGLWQYHDFFAAKSVLEDHASVNMSLTLRGGWNVGVTPSVASYAFNPAAYAGLLVPGDSLGAGVPFVPGGRLGARLVNFSIATPQFQRFDASLGTSVGNDVDFLEAARVRRVDYSASVDLRPSSRLRVNATYVSSAFRRRLDGSTSTFTHIPRVKVEYQLTRSIFVRVVSQYSATDRDALRDPVTGVLLLVDSAGTVVPTGVSAANALRTDWLFSYRPTPGTVFFFGYGGSLSEPQALAFRGLRRTTDGFFVKGSYVLRL
jgi:hypothetical protein